MGLLLAFGLLLMLPHAIAGTTLECRVPQESAPQVEKTGDDLVRLRCETATALEVIQAVGRQTRRPIGLVFGRDEGRLTRERRSYDLRGVSAESALLEALNGTGYTMREEDGVLVLRAGDASPRAEEILQHRFAVFPGGTDARPMFMLAQQLTAWVWAEIEPGCGLAMGGAYSYTEPLVQLPTLHDRTAEEIANAMVQLGLHGMWTLRVADPVTQTCSGPRSWFAAENYQVSAKWPMVQSPGLDSILKR